MAKSNRFPGIHLAPSFILPLHCILSPTPLFSTFPPVTVLWAPYSQVIYPAFPGSHSPAPSPLTPKYCNASGSVLGWFFEPYTHSDDFKYILTMHKCISQPSSSFEIQTYIFSLTYVVRCLTSIFFFFASLIGILVSSWEENNKVIVTNDYNKKWFSMNDRDIV